MAASGRSRSLIRGPKQITDLRPGDPRTALLESPQSTGEELVEVRLLVVM